MSLTIIRYPDPPGDHLQVTAVGTTVGRALANLPADTPSGELLDGVLSLMKRLNAEQLGAVVRACREAGLEPAPVGYDLVPAGAITLPDSLPMIDPYADTEADVSDDLLVIPEPDVIDAPHVIDGGVSPDDDDPELDEPTVLDERIEIVTGEGP